MMNKIVFLLTIFLLISCNRSPKQVNEKGIYNRSDSLTRILDKIKTVEYKNLDSLEYQATRLANLKGDEEATLLSNYYRLKANFLRRPTYAWTDSLVSIYAELKKKNEFKLLAEIDYFLLWYYYTDLRFLKASERVKGSFDYCFKPGLELERHAFMFAVSPSSVFTTPEIRKEDILKYLKENENLEWNFYWSRIHIALAKSHYYLKEYDKALEVIDYTIDQNKKYEFELELIDSYETKAALLKVIKPDSQEGVENYKKAIDAAVRYGSYSQETYYRMIGHFYFEKENFKKAQENYEKAIEFGHLLNDSTSLAVDYGYLGWAIFKQDEQNNYPKANEYYEKGIQYSGLKGMPYRQALERRIWSLEALGRKAEADKYNLQKILATNEALRNQNNAELQDFKINTMLGLKDRSAHLELLQAKNEAQKRKLLLNNYIKVFAIVVFAMFLIAWYNYFKKLKANRLLKERKEVIKKANKELEEKNKLISKQNQTLKYKEEELVAELKAKLAMLSENEYIFNDLKTEVSENHNIPIMERKKVLSKIESKSGRRVIDSLDFQFIELHKSFYAKMSELHPNLTSNNLKMCVYLKMNLSSKEIASIMHITPGAVMVARSRLRKKLNLDESQQSLSVYLNSI